MCLGFKYKYIIVDEFQDISLSRMLFLKKLISHGHSKLFAVGDDWQAIYRFSGCDLNIFLKFADYFGASAITKITTTHRNSQELQDIAGPFIKSNPEQFNKSINSSRHLEHPVQIMYYDDEKYSAFMNVLKEISKIDENANVLILGRNNKDFESIALDNRIYIDFKESKETKTVIKVRDFPNMKFSYSTVHGSKGLEEDYVIIINADDSRLGFPNKVEDDELLDMVLSSKSDYEYAEERRLWYVALTRTRTYTYIIANRQNPSIFVEEIENQCLIMNPNEESKEYEKILCPDCKTGKLVFRTNEENNNQFFGCSNYPYCKYTINDVRAVNRNRRCKICGDFLVYRKGPWGAFYGCHNYPRCNYKEEYTK
jgi:DNA helicase-4